MKENSKKFKIDISRSSLFKYGLFKKTFFGWKELYRSDHIDWVEEKLRDYKRLPRYFDFEGNELSNNV